MAMVKEALAHAEKNGSMMRHEKSKNKQEGRRWVRPLFPSEPTTIEKAVLDKAIEDAIEKRLGQRK